MFRVPRPDFDLPEDLSSTDAGDVYRVGALLYAMLTTKSPRPRDLADNKWHDEIEVTIRRSHSPRDLNAVSERLDRICMKCLEPSPADRYASLRDLMKDLGSGTFR
jgi:serine/threonine protein kinase